MLLSVRFFVCCWLVVVGWRLFAVCSHLLLVRSNVVDVCCLGCVCLSCVVCCCCCCVLCVVLCV